MLNNYTGRLVHNATNNDSKMHVNGNSSASLTLNNSTQATTSLTCGAISCSGTTTKTTVPTAAGVYIGMDSSSSGGIEICSSTVQYIDFTGIDSDYNGNILYTNNKQ
jgi:hypothetical protein